MARILFALELALFLSAPLCAKEVSLRFFHSQCSECERTREYLDEIKAALPEAAICDLPLEEDENYALLMALEKDLGLANENNAPVSVFLHTNAFYGFSDITNRLPKAVMASLISGAPLYEPKAAGETPQDLAQSRMAGFKATSIIVNGLLDGINPCAFATLILFISLLSVYGSSKKEMLMTGLAFTLGVFLTYLFLGLGLLQAVKSLAAFPKIQKGFNCAMAAFCLVCALLSAKDAMTVAKKGQAESHHDLFLKLPKKARDLIAKTLHSRAGRGRFLFGVIMAGFLVSLLESVCTGQVYLPTISLIVRQSPAALTAWAWLVLYNLLFVAPLLLLTFLGAYGLKSQTMLKCQRRLACPIRILLALLFLAMGLFLLF